MLLDLPVPVASGLDSLVGGAEGSGEGVASKDSAALGNVFGKG